MRHPRFTFANVMSCLALFVALGGASYAAVALPKNSVGSRQIKPGAIDNSKIKPGSLLNSAFRPGQVPAGPRGASGPAGPAGPPGLAGAQGPAELRGRPAAPAPSRWWDMRRLRAKRCRRTASGIRGLPTRSLPRRTRCTRFGMTPGLHGGHRLARTASPVLPTRTESL